MGIDGLKFFFVINQNLRLKIWNIKINVKGPLSLSVLTVLQKLYVLTRKKENKQTVSACFH